MRLHTRLKKLKELTDRQTAINRKYGEMKPTESAALSEARKYLWGLESLKVKMEAVKLRRTPVEEDLGAWHMPFRLLRWKSCNKWKSPNGGTTPLGDEHIALHHLSTFKGKLWAASVVFRSAARRVRRKSDAHLMRQHGLIE